MLFKMISSTSSEESEGNALNQKSRSDENFFVNDQVKESKNLCSKKRKKRKKMKEGTSKDALVSVRSKGKEVEPVKVQFPNGQSIQIPKSELNFEKSKIDLKKDELLSVFDNGINNTKDVLISTISKKPAPAPRYVHLNALAKVENSDESSLTTLSLINGKSSSDDVEIEIMDKEFLKMTKEKDKINLKENKSNIYQSRNGSLMDNSILSLSNAEAKIINQDLLPKEQNLKQINLNNLAKIEANKIIKNDVVKDESKMFQKNLQNDAAKMNNQVDNSLISEKSVDIMTNVIKDGLPKKFSEKLNIGLINKQVAKVIDKINEKETDKVTNNLIETVKKCGLEKILDKPVTAVNKIANKVTETRLLEEMVSKGLNKIINKTTDKLAEKIDSKKVLEKLKDKISEKLISDESDLNEDKKKFKNDIKNEVKDQVKNYVKNNFKSKMKIKNENSEIESEVKEVNLVKQSEGSNEEKKNEEKKNEEKKREEKKEDEAKKNKKEKDKVISILLNNRTMLTPSQRLIMLCRKGDWLAVDTLLKQIDPEAFDTNIVSEGNLWSPLMYAAKDNRVNIIDKLLDIGYNVNQKAVDGITALHLSCLHAREDTIRLLLARKADPLIAGGPKKQLPIHVIASKATGAAVVPLQLILRSCSANIRMIVDKDGNIPLLLAADTDNHGVCQELLSDLAKEQLSYRRPETEETAIHIATKHKDLDMLKMMVESGGDVNIQNKNGQTPLHIASANGDETFVRFFFGAKANPNIEDKEERTPLHLATENGHTKVVELLTEKFKASLTARTKDGSTLMHIASKSGQPMTALNFLKKGVPLHMPNKNGAKAIHMAASSGQVDVVKSALQRGECVDVTTNDGMTPLHIAIGAGECEVVETLLGNGASVHLKTGKSEETPLHIASRVKKGKSCARLLIKSGADVNALDKNLETPLHVAGRAGFLDIFKLLIETGADPSLQNAKGENCLHTAVGKGHFPIVQYLIKFIIKKKSKEFAEKLINQRNKLGETSVHYAANTPPSKAHEDNEDRDLIRLLLENGGDVSLGTTETEETVVHYCSKSGNTNILKKIIEQLQPLEAQVACNKPAKNGWSPLLYACNYGHPEIIKILLAQNARVDIFDEKGRAGLHLASELGREDVVDILLANNAFVNVRNKSGLTPLHLAAKNGFNNMVKKLVSEYGAHLDPCTLNKQTPLHLAAENGQYEVCNTLLNMKADINAMDNQSQTPLHLAAQSDHPQVLKLFLEHELELVSVPNKNGFTCAHIAATKGSVAALKELMKFNQEVVKLARIKKTGSTALHLAAEGGHVKVVRLLLQAGAKASDENLEGMTPLHLAAKQGHLGVLYELKNSVDWKLCSRKTGLTALHVAASYGQTNFVSEMLAQVPAGILSERPLGEPNSDYEITPLHLAAQNGHESVVRLLMNSTGVQVDAPTKVHETIPMHLAAQGGHMLVAGLLISRSADSLFKRDKQGRTCVYLAAAYGHQEMVGLLLGQGADINAQDKKGWTPLHQAARHGYLNVVQLLINNGADPTTTNKDGRIPICCAAAAGHYEVLSYLLNKDHDSLQLMEDKTFLMDLINCSKNHNNKPIREFILVSAAPIDTAVKLAKQYENLAFKEKERARDLELASCYCDQISIDLLSIAATTNNAGSLLRAKDQKKNIEFLDVLIELERKDVVAQHAVQKYLTDVWMGNLKWSGLEFVLLFFAFLFCPIIWIIISTPLKHRLHKIPIIKFMSYLTAHIFFISLLIYTTVFPAIKLYQYTSCVPKWNEWLLLLWLIGILVSDMTNPSDKSGLGGIQVCILVIGFAAVLVHIVVWIFDSFVYQEFEPSGNATWPTTKLDTLYARNQLLAFCMLLSFIEFLNFLTFHPLFGPWSVIIEELIQDLLRFLAILSIFLTGFTLHICAIYQPVYNAPGNWNMTILPIGQDFLKPDKSFEMLFYALFGLVEPDTMPPMHLSPDFAKIIMKIVFGVYMMVTVIVLINLLIAMMSNTYQRIEAQSDIEWKFGRAKLIRNMNKTLSTPSPINLLVGIPVMLFTKTREKCKQNRLKEMHIAKKAFGHLAQQRASLITAKPFLNRRVSHLSRTTQITNTCGSFLEAGLEISRPIVDVVNWNLIVQKYYESIGVVSFENAEEESGSQINENEDDN